MQNGKINCPQCNKPVEPEWEFCPYCGKGKSERLPDAHPAQTPVPADSGILPPEAESGQWPAKTGSEPLRRPQPVPLRSKPTTPPPYAILLLDEHEINIPALGRRLARILRLPLAELTVRMRNTKGVIARDVPAGKLEPIADAIDELNRESIPLNGGGSSINAVAVSESELAGLPEICRTPEIRAAGNVLRCQATTDSEQWSSVGILPANVSLVVTGRVMYTVQKRTCQQKYDPYARNFLLRKRYVKEEDATRQVARECRGHEYIIYLFMANPVRLLQIDDRRFDEFSMERHFGREEQMQLQARLLMRMLDPELVDSGLRMLARLDAEDPRWDAGTFATERGLQAYAQWRYNRNLIAAGE